ncbi:MAG: hypothetical protein LPJ96_04985 [Exiguobacterium sp.]|nr:hypothetical protein [Exiguobacterium sp.]MDX5424701.1 hypothetical protein [Exiguobacterium sp.]MDX6772176.1 hypothetical protein [Exiguobacterium sp.]
MYEKTLKRVFGYEAFREGQRDVIEAVADGQDVLAIMPTGGRQVVDVPATVLY